MTISYTNFRPLVVPAMLMACSLEASDLLLNGTGSLYDVENIHHWQGHLESRSPVNVDNHYKSDFRTPKQHIENIRNVFDPSISTLANIFEVSRQSIYKWLSESSNPEVDKIKKIKEISLIADAVVNAGVERKKDFLEMKNRDGRSLLDLLKNKESYEAHVNGLIKEMKEMTLSYQRSGLSQTKSIKSKDWLNSVSIPTYFDEV